jgi:hypothetical protein
MYGGSGGGGGYYGGSGGYVVPTALNIDLVTGLNATDPDYVSPQGLGGAGAAPGAGVGANGNAGLVVILPIY